MASDAENEREAAGWCDALIGDSSEPANELLNKLDKFNSEPFPAKCQPATPKSDVFE
jgi:hypothetical protein